MLFANAVDVFGIQPTDTNLRTQVPETLYAISISCQTTIPCHLGLPLALKEPVSTLWMTGTEITMKQ